MRSVPTPEMHPRFGLHRVQPVVSMPWARAAPEGSLALQTQKLSRRWRGTHVSGWTPTCGWQVGAKGTQGVQRGLGQARARGLAAEMTSHEHCGSVSLHLFKKHPPPVPLLPRADLILTGVSENKIGYARFSSTIGTREPLLPGEQRRPFTLHLFPALIITG